MSKTKDGPQLTPMQERFVAGYLVHLNGKQAAVEAGYSARTAKEQAADLLTRPHIAKAVAEGKAKQLKVADISAIRVLEELRRVAMLDPAECFDEDGTLLPITMIPVATRAAIAFYEAGDKPKVRFVGKLEALNTLARHLGLLKDVVVMEDTDKLVALLRAGRQRAAERSQMCPPLAAPNP